jgi:hypothetical protein
VGGYCVPDLQFDCFFSDGDHLGSEFDADGDLVLLSEAVVDELQQQAGLADAWVRGRVPVSPIMMNLNMYEKDIFGNK